MGIAVKANKFTPASASADRKRNASPGRSGTVVWKYSTRRISWAMISSVER
jgi:hypothetical protein